jgi:CheY-like chemotaxis protein
MTRHPTVVVVDDEPDVVVTLLALLREQGYDAEGFGSGRAALEGIARLAPDVIISDIAMPAPNGWDIARHVSEQKGAKAPLLIALSGRYLKGADRILAQMNGFDFYLTKPCDPQALMTLIEQARPG